MNLSTSARNVSYIVTAGIAALVLITSIWLLIIAEIRYSRLAVAVGPTIIIALSGFVLRTIYLAYRRNEANSLLQIWTFALGCAAPFVPPTVRQMFMLCRPPATRCEMIGAAPWPILAACFVGLALAAYAFLSEPNRSKLSSKELAPIADRLRMVSATLALVAGTLFIWVHYDLSARDLKDAIDNAVAAERARAAGRMLVTDSVDGPSEALIVFMGLIATLTIGSASFTGSTNKLTLLWPFVLGLISSPLMGAFGSIGSFGWGYRDFVEKYAWFAIFVVCFIGLLTVQLANSHLRNFNRSDRR